MMIMMMIMTVMMIMMMLMIMMVIMIMITCIRADSNSPLLWIDVQQLGWVGGGHLHKPDGYDDYHDEVVYDVDDDGDNYNKIKNLDLLILPELTPFCQSSRSRSSTPVT